MDREASHALFAALADDSGSVRQLSPVVVEKGALSLCPGENSTACKAG